MQQRPQAYQSHTGHGKPVLRPLTGSNWCTAKRNIVASTHFCRFRLGVAAVDAPTIPAGPADTTILSAADSAAAPSPPAPEAAPAAADQLFDWALCWYPVAALSSLNPDAPNALQLLGQRLVVWKDKQAAWRAFEDACPHRLVPLSEGRLHESGDLQCTYHGWRFDSSGTCTNIPQIPDPKALSTAFSSSRACVKAYPTQELHGMLWVFGDPSAEGWKASGAASAAGPTTPSSAFDEMLEGSLAVKSPWFQRDVPLSFETLMENLHDPSHVPQSHSGVIGHRDTDQRMTVTPQGPVTREGYSVNVEEPLMNYVIQYKAPSLVRWNFPGMYLTLYATPTARGWSRLFMTFVGPPDAKRARPVSAAIPWFADLIMGFLDTQPALLHALNRNTIIDGDTYFMHVGERVFYSKGKGHGDWSRQYYMPATADVAVLAWRKWIDRFGMALPVLPKDVSDLPPVMPREQVFDRYNQHTKHCPHCMAALRNVTIAAAVVAAVAAVSVGSIVAAAVAGSVPLLSSFNAGAAAAATAAGLLAAGLLKLRQLFIYTDYVHAEH